MSGSASVMSAGAVRRKESAGIRILRVGAIRQLRREKLTGRDGIEGRGDLPDQMAGHSQLDSDLDSGFQHNIRNQKHGADADRLFNHLSECRNPGTLHTIIVTVDAGMDSGAGYGDGYVGEKRCTARFHQDAAGQKILEPDDEPGQDKRG